MCGLSANSGQSQSAQHLETPTWARIRPLKTFTKNFNGNEVIKSLNGDRELYFNVGRAYSGWEASFRVGTHLGSHLAPCYHGHVQLHCLNHVNMAVGNVD